MGPEQEHNNGVASEEEQGRRKSWLELREDWQGTPKTCNEVKLLEKKNSEKWEEPEVLPAINPKLIVICYVVNNILHAYFMGSTDALKEFMKVLGVGSHLGDPAALTIYLTKLMNITMTSCLVLGLPLGIFLDKCGPRLAVLVGIASNAGAICLWGISSGVHFHWVGAILMGIPPLVVINGHLSVSNLFPKHSGTVVGILASSCDFNLVIPLVLTSIAVRFGAIAMSAGFALVSLFSAVLTCYIVPNKVFSPPKSLPEARFLLESNATSPYTEDCEQESNSSTRGSDTDEEYDTAEALHTPPLAHLTVFQQLLSICFLLYATLFIFNVFRRNYFLQTIREIYTEISHNSGGTTEDAMHYADLNNLILAIPCLAVPFYVLSDKWGFWWMAAATNLIGMILYASCGYLGLIPGQWVSMIAFTLYTPFIFGQMTLFVLKTFGYRSLGTLQGVQNIFALLGIWSYEPFMRLVEVCFEGSHVTGCRWLAGLSVVFFFVPLGCWYVTRHPVKSQTPKSLELNPKSLNPRDSFWNTLVPQNHQQVLVHTSLSGQTSTNA